MKVALYCALIGAVLAAPTVTTIAATNSDGPVAITAGISDPQRSIGIPITNSLTGTPGNTLSFVGTGFTAAQANVGVAGGCTGAGCCANFATNPNRVIIGAVQPATLTATSLSFTLTPTQLSINNAYGSPKLVNGGELCIINADTTTVNTGAILRLFWSCGAQYAAVPVRPCGTFISTAAGAADQAPFLLGLLSPAAYADEVFGKTTPTTTVAGVASCECQNSLNPRIARCAGKPYDPASFQCCSGTTIIPIGQRCQCTRATTPQGSGGVSSLCPSTAPNCCLQQKYTAITTTNGECFNPTTEACCDTGFAFNKGTSRCCPINGIQSLDIPCPCQTDDHCSGGTFVSGQRESVQKNMACCVQQGLTDPVFCNTFVNYPSGTGDARTSRCSGFCINTDYQLCCNGVACLAMYEKCCNTTCCNRFIGTCDKNNRGPDMTTLETCSTIQQMNPLRAFWLFIFPAALLFSTLTALALALVFANKAASREFSITERAMIVFSVLLSILIIPLYFSPLYKYGLFMVLIAAWTILTAAVRVKLLNVVAVLLYIILFVYLFDPFTGSQFLNLAYFRDTSGQTDFQSNGIWHTTKRLAEPTINGIPTFRQCTNYFDYFVLDERLRDFRTDNYRVTTFGYCSNQYILALYLFEGFQILCALVLTILSIIGLVLRFRKKTADPIELEVVPQ